ncbi:MAG: Crp/Fnr family transcriptional regulator [Chloroflexales bacterium]|nr:Crp/Fnr family transcriptional regulator [Chloroflexales bacterium]
MCQLFLTGNWSNAYHFLTTLHQHGYSLMWAPCTGCPIQCHPIERVLPLVAVTNEADLLPLATLREQRSLPWIAWMRLEHPQLASLLYQAGALAVLPPDSSAETLLQAVGNACVTLGYNQKEHMLHVRTRERHYQRGDEIVLDVSDVLDIQQGIVTMSVIYQDGTEVLLGFYGSGHVLVHHPNDDYCMMFRAHTDIIVHSYPWYEVVKDPVFAERLRTYSAQTATWSALRSHPYIEQRVIGILRFLAEQFGTPHLYGILIDIRITHAQLAAASSTTRGTITRIMKELRRRNQVISVSYGNEERFCLCAYDDHNAILKQK